MFIEGLHEKSIYTEDYPFRLVENMHPDFNYPLHWHSAAEILYVAKNSYEIIINKETLRLKEKDIVYIAPGDLHSFSVSNTDGLRFFIQFDPAKLDGLGIGALKPFTLETAYFSVQDSSVSHQALEEQIVKLVDEYRQKRPAYQYAINARIFDIMAILWENSLNIKPAGKNAQSGKKPYVLEKLDKALEYVEKNYRNEITLEEAARYSGFSTFHFSRIFKDTMEKNFHNYLNEYRIKKSESLLSDPGYSITQAAFLSGFNSLPTFNRVFRQVKGCTPTVFRKLYSNLV